jgi:hypothetical protein
MSNELNFRIFSCFVLLPYSVAASHFVLLLFKHTYIVSRAATSDSLQISIHFNQAPISILTNQSWT